jgi:hypothetical protein
VALPGFLARRVHGCSFADEGHDAMSALGVSKFRLPILKSRPDIQEVADVLARLDDFVAVEEDFILKTAIASMCSASKAAETATRAS